MKSFFTWDKADSFCPVEAASPPPFNLSSLFSQSRITSLTSSTPLFTTTTDPTSLCAQVSSLPTGALSTQDLILDQLTKLASHQSSKLTPPSDQIPANAASSGPSSTKSCANEASIPVHQQQQKQLNSFLNALATNTTSNTNATVNNSSAPSAQQQHQNLIRGSSAADVLFGDVSNALIQKTTSELLGAAANNAAVSLVTSAMGIYDNTTTAAKLSGGLINTAASIQQQPPALNTSAQFLGMLTGQQSQSLPPANHLLGSGGSAMIQQQQPHQNPSGSLDSTTTRSTLLQIMGQTQQQSSSSSATSNNLAGLDGVREHSQGIIGNSLIGGGQPSAFDIVQKASSIQQLLNQKQMIDQQIMQLTQLGATNQSPSDTTTVCSSAQIHQKQPAQQQLNILMDLVQQQQQQGNQQALKESKPIPLWNTPIDLERFRRVSPYQWTSDDVVGWILDVARSHNIPCENLSLVKFSQLNGSMMLQMKEHDFMKYDMCYGSLLFNEFCKACSSDVMKNWMGSSSGVNEPLLSLQLQQQQQTLQPPQQPSQASPNLLLSAASQLVGDQQKMLPQSSPLLHLRPSPIGHQQLQQQLQQAAQQQLLRPLLQQAIGGLQQASTSSAFQHLQMGSGESTSQLVENPSGSKVKKVFIRKNKDGRPRKRSQHTKGNKLWEFIRDALKDPKYCPSVVRWEDANEGVFRIVESERLAYLWGQKKNNVKMTYEKLSRAMRTYYEKEILVPVPKCGLYPKKLVYKFGPSAHGWRSVTIHQPNANMLFPGPTMNGLNINVTTTC